MLKNSEFSTLQMRNMNIDTKFSLRNTQKLKITTKALIPSPLVTTNFQPGHQMKWKNFLPKKLIKIKNMVQMKSHSGFIKTRLTKVLIGESKELHQLLEIKDNAEIQIWLLQSMRCQWLTVLEPELTFNFHSNNWLIVTP